MRTSLIVEKDRPPFIWTKQLEKRGYWGVHPVGRRFNRRRIDDWIIAIIYLWRTSEPIK